MRPGLMFAIAPVVWTFGCMSPDRQAYRRSLQFTLVHVITLRHLGVGVPSSFLVKSLGRPDYSARGKALLVALRHQPRFARFSTEYLRSGCEALGRQGALEQGCSAEDVFKENALWVYDESRHFPAMPGDPCYDGHLVATFVVGGDDRILAAFLRVRPGGLREIPSIGETETGRPGRL